MEKNQKNSPFERFLRKTRFWKSSPSKNTSNGKNREAEVVPIEFDYKKQHTAPPPTQKNGILPQTAPRQWNKPHQHHVHVSQEASKKTAQHIEDGFTDYINKAKIKIRAMSNVGEGHGSIAVSDYGGNGKESVDNRFSDFIKHARMKIRTASSVRDRSE